MANAPGKLPRNDIAKFIGDPRSIRHYEAMQDFVGAGKDASFLTVDPSSDLGSERVIDFSANFETNDGGPGGAYAVDLSDTGVTPGTYSGLEIDEKGRILSATAGPSVSPGLILLQSGTISSPVAALDITSDIDASSDEYELHLFDFLPSANATLGLQASGNGGASWRNGASEYANGHSYNVTTTPTVLRDSSNAGKIVPLNAIPGGRGISGKIILYKPAASQRLRALIDATYTSASGGITDLTRTSGTFEAATAASTNALRLLFATGNITSGSYAFYKVRK